MAALTDEHGEEWSTKGRLLVRGGLSPSALGELDAATRELETWAANGGPGLHHHEMTDEGPKLARSEDFAPHSPVLAALLQADELIEPLTELFGEAPVLFKEKVNYKHPGGAGFAPHQDATAYRFVDHHISVMVPLDAATVDSGCLWFTTKRVEGVIANDAGRIVPAWVAGYDWEPVEVDAGDLVFFDSYTPHYSETNNAPHSRRALYLTYNAASAGDFRATYYADKQALLDAEGTGERARISVNDDFLGRPVPG